MNRLPINKGLREASKITIVGQPFTLLESIPAGKKQHTLWGGQLSNGREQYVACLHHPVGRPQYTKAFPSLEEALTFFSKVL